MKMSCFLPVTLLFLSTFAAAAVPDAPQPQQQQFFTTEHTAEIGVLAASLSVDGWATQRVIAQGGGEYNPIARPFVTHGAIGQATACTIGMVAVVGSAYLLHRHGHERAATWLLRFSAAGETLNAVYAVRVK